MHPILNRPRRLLWYVLAWVLAGLVAAWLLVVIQSAVWGGALLFALPALLLLGFILTSAYYVARSLPFAKRNFYRVVFIFCGSSLLSALAWLSLCLVWNNFLNGLNLSGAGITITTQLSISLFIISSLLYLVSLLAQDVFIAFENFHESERRQAAMQVFTREAELQVLRNQINPHFLFNSLNSISALTAIDAIAARSMAIELGNFYRKTLTVSTNPKITLSEELELCEHFLTIEKIRFGEKLKTTFNIEPKCLVAKVPAMFLQPLFENAIKHGICKLDDGGVIFLKCFIHEGWLYISLSNPIEKNPSVTIGTGTGLNNLKARFENLYGEKSRTHWYELQNIFSVDMIIPLEF